MDKIIPASFNSSDGGWVTINVAKSGKKLNNPDGSVDISRTGHVWMTIDNGEQKIDVGWSTGNSLKTGGYDNISLNDSEVYDKSTVKSFTASVSEVKFPYLVECINDAPLGKLPGFSSNYNLLTNNCIDFFRTCLDTLDLGGKSMLPHFTPNGNFNSLAKLIDKNFDTADNWGNDWSTETSYSEGLLSPLVIDLNGDGVKTIPDGSIYFDMSNDGVNESVGWVDKSDGFLVYDKNNDGNINSGGKLFGNYSDINGISHFKNGFEALSELDANNDSIISRDDDEWSKVKIWKDGNSNGIVDKNELMSLSDAGIKEINLKYTEEPYIDKYGNRHKEISTVTWSNDETTSIVDVWFKYNSKLTKGNINASTQQEIHKMINSISEFGAENIISSHNQMIPRQDNPVAILATSLDV
ncbi:hypothetical protein [Xenorhabdus szentirmaii]|uniref:Complete genome segment 14/17 n=1 Tax=Xenorhabdus szentirmaii DSM 16338 TaxID=1427518 RepID=W1IYT0_9GAMM|nr:hypothetical protein [Xenorhabdus szentirmaii]PHM30463.1 iron-regulated protein FrpC [Xenorhabdus szentirmaii DSM 16338]CDL83637.1 putative Complete genome; segment 14/17 [Xenorhabdus szentirmaii DSM 16338]